MGIEEEAESELHTNTPVEVSEVRSSEIASETKKKKMKKKSKEKKGQPDIITIINAEHCKTSLPAKNQTIDFTGSSMVDENDPRNNPSQRKRKKEKLKNNSKDSNKTEHSPNKIKRLSGNLDNDEQVITYKVNSSSHKITEELMKRKEKKLKKANKDKKARNVEVEIVQEGIKKKQKKKKRKSTDTAMNGIANE